MKNKRNEKNIYKKEKENRLDQYFQSAKNMLCVVGYLANREHTSGGASLPSPAASTPDGPPEQALMH